MSVLALEHLYQGVVASFAEDGINAVNVFGRRQVAQHYAGARIVWVPGDPGDNVGTMAGARNPGGLTRSLGTLLELCTLYISADDPSAPFDELAQYRITRMLRDAWFRAAYLVAHGTFTVRGEAWMTEQKELQNGATIRLVLELQAPVVDALPDEPLIGGSIEQSDTIDAREVALAADTTLGTLVTTELDDTGDTNIDLPPGSIPDDE